MESHGEVSPEPSPGSVFIQHYQQSDMEQDNKSLSTSASGAVANFTAVLWARGCHCPGNLTCRLNLLLLCFKASVQLLYVDSKCSPVENPVNVCCSVLSFCALVFQQLWGVCISGAAVFSPLLEESSRSFFAPQFLVVELLLDLWFNPISSLKQC